MNDQMIQDLRGRRQHVYDQLRALVDPAADENRAFTDEEEAQYHPLSAELDALDQRLCDLRDGEQRARNTENAFANLTHGRNAPAFTALREVDEMILDGRAGRVEVELRAVTTANAGARTGVDAGTFLPPLVHERAGIPFEVANALNIQGPNFPKLSAGTATPEGTAKPVATDPTLNDVALGAFAEQTTISDQVVRFGTGEAVYSQALLGDVIHSVNAHVVDTLEAAATALAFATSAQQTVDTAVATIEADTGNATAIIINPANYHLLANKDGIGDRPDTAIRAWNGVPLVVSDAADAGFATVVNGAAYRLHGTAFIFRQQDLVGSNERVLLVEMYAGLLEHRAGAAIKADIVTP